MKITLIRHTSVAVEPGICYGCTDVEVAPSFREEASLVAQTISREHFDAIYSSPLLRCRKLAAFCGYADPKTDDRLKELDFGSWEMQKWDNINDPALQDWYEDWIHLPAGGAESYEEQCHRVASFLNELRQKDHRQVCIFTHRGVIAGAMVYAGLCSVENSFSIDVPYGSTRCLEI